MADIKLKFGATQSCTITDLNSLSQLTYTNPSNFTAVDNTSLLYVDVLVEVTIANIAETGNKQVVVYAINSLDGTNYSDGQGSANPQGMRLLGIVPLNGAGEWRSPAMSLAAAFGGVVPPKWKLVFYNDNSSTALAASGNSVQYRGVHYQVV